MSKSEHRSGPKQRPAKPRADSPWVSRGVFRRSVGIAAARGEAGVPHTLFVMHVERLNDIATRCGSDAEAAVLDLIALALRNLTGEQFPLCRLKNDRLAVIKHDCAPTQAPAVARQIHASIEGGVFTWRARHFRLGVSVGAVVLLPESTGADGLIQRALEASVAAQDMGNQNCLVMDGTPEEKARLEKDRAWLERLSETIA